MIPSNDDHIPIIAKHTPTGIAYFKADHVSGAVGITKNAEGAIALTLIEGNTLLRADLEAPSALHLSRILAEVGAGGGEVRL